MSNQSINADFIIKKQTQNYKKALFARSSVAFVQANHKYHCFFTQQ